jgi:ABC-type transporter Mla MlaB component
MLKIRRIPEKGGTRLFLSGEVRGAHIEDLRIEIASAAAPVSLDLQEVGLVDIDGIRLLNEYRTQGAKVENCAPYIREWMRQETPRKKDR